MKCNSFMAEKELNITNKQSFNPSLCHNELIIESKEACPKANFYTIWVFVNKYSFLIGAILMIVGLFETFLGSKLVTITIFIVACAVTVTLVFIFLFQFIIPNNTHHYIVWVVLGISLVLGIVLGYLTARFKKVALGFTLGGYMGYIGGLMLYTFALNRINANPNVSIVYNCS